MNDPIGMYVVLTFIGMLFVGWMIPRGDILKTIQRRVLRSIYNAFVDEDVKALSRRDLEAIKKT